MNKNIGLMYFMYCAFVHACFAAQSCPTLQAHGLYPAMLLSMGFPRQECWSGLPIPPPGDLPDPGLKPHILRLLHWQAGSSALHHLGSPLCAAVFLKWWYLILSGHAFFPRHGAPFKGISGTSVYLGCSEVIWCPLPHRWNKGRHRAECQIYCVLCTLLLPAFFITFQSSAN